MRFKFKNKSAKEGCGVREPDFVRGGKKKRKSRQKGFGLKSIAEPRKREGERGGDLTEALAVCKANSP